MFCSRNYGLQKKPLGRPDPKLDSEELKAIVDPFQSTSELGVGCSVSYKIPFIPLEVNWESEKACKVHYTAQFNFKSIIINCNEKWNAHRNGWTLANQPNHDPSKNLLQQNYLWGGGGGLAPISFDTAFINQVRRLRQMSIISRLVNRSRPPLLQDNTIQHNAQQMATLVAIRGAWIGMSKTSTVLPRSCTNRIPFFFRNLDSFLLREKSTPMGQSKAPLKILLIPPRYFI